MVVVSFKEEVMRIAKERVCALTLFVILAGVLSASAQRLDGDMTGEVKDPKGLLVANAKVTIISQGTGVKRQTETSEAGAFFAANLQPGLYTVDVEQPGFKKVVKPGIEVIANRLAEVSITLELGSASETVTVEAGAQLVETQTATLGQTFTDAQLRSPIIAQGGLTGNVINLAILAPGTTTQPGGVEIGRAHV